MNYTFNPKSIAEQRYFFRMIEKIKRRGYRPSDVFFFDIDDLKQIPELTANNLLIILQLQKMFKEACVHGKRERRICNN